MTNQATNIVDLKTSIEADQADRLGELRAEIKILQDEAKAIEAALKLDGPRKVDGLIFSVNIIHAERTTTNWKAIAAKLEASRQMITANSKTATVVTVKVTGHAK